MKENTRKIGRNTSIPLYSAHQLLFEHMKSDFPYFPLMKINNFTSTQLIDSSLHSYEEVQSFDLSRHTVYNQVIEKIVILFVIL